MQRLGIILILDTKLILVFLSGPFLRAILISYLILLTLSLINSNVKLYTDDTMKYSAHSNPNVLEITE